MTTQDYYRTLGIERGAAEEEIRSSYRKLAMQYHPDRNPDNEEAAEKFKAISEAYAVLSDSQKRQQYDMGGRSAFGAGAGAGTSFSDVFGDIFGQVDSMFSGRGRRPSRTGPQSGTDLEYVLEISLEDALAGTKKDIHFEADAACDTCDGKGYSGSGGPVTCSSCGGEGMVRVGGGLAFVAQTCTRCSGSGQTVSNPCKACHGKGLKRRRRRLQVNIPAGIDYGQTLRLGGQGGDGVRGGEPGDLYVRISVKEHAVFERDGDDLRMELPLSFAQAALGDQVEIGTADRKLRIKVPAGIQSGQVLRVRGQGAPVLRQDRRGDLLCRVRVQTPTKLSRKQRELLEQLIKQPEEKGSGGWREKASKFFEAIAG